MYADDTVYRSERESPIPLVLTFHTKSNKKQMMLD